jgi:hypothetical protein
MNRRKRPGQSELTNVRSLSLKRQVRVIIS